MKYGAISSKKQYGDYCKKHLEIGRILGAGKGTKDLEDEYYILGLIIQDYNSNQRNPFEKLTPVDLLKALMDESGLSGYKLSKEIGVSNSIISEILNYKRGFSKSVIRKLSDKFGVGEQSFLKEYELINKEQNVA